MGDTIKARVYSIDNDKILLYPVLSSYEASIRNRELSRFFFTVVEKFSPMEVDVLFDNGEKADFAIANKFLWDALREDDIYCEFQIDKQNDNILTYKYWQQASFKENHPVGDLVKVRIAFLNSRKCIAWCDGIVAIVNDYVGKNLEVGKEYFVMVTYNEKDQLDLKWFKDGSDRTD